MRAGLLDRFEACGTVVGDDHIVHCHVTAHGEADAHLVAGVQTGVGPYMFGLAPGAFEQQGLLYREFGAGCGLEGGHRVGELCIDGAPGRCGARFGDGEWRA